MAWDDFPWGDNGNSLGSLNSASSMPPSSLVPSLAGGDSGAVVNKFGLVFLKNVRLNSFNHYGSTVSMQGLLPLHMNRVPYYRRGGP